MVVPVAKLMPNSIPQKRGISRLMVRPAVT